MAKAGGSKTAKPGDDQLQGQSRAAAVTAAIKLFGQVEDAFGTEYAQQVFELISAPKFRRSVRAIKLLAFIHRQLRGGRTKQDIVDHLTFRQSLALDLPADLRRSVIRTRDRMLRMYGIAPATAERPLSIRAHIDKLLVEELPPEFHFLLR